MPGHIHPVRIPTRYYKPIGQIAAGWTLTEALLASIISHINRIRSVKRGRLLAYRPTADAKLKIFKVTVKHFAKPALRSDLNRLLARASDLKKKRNKMVHGLWGRMPTERKTWKVFFYRDTEDMILLQREAMTVADVARIASDVEQLNRDLKKWMAKHKIPPP